MYYKIKKDKRSGNFVVTRPQYCNDSFKSETSAKRVLQFDSALLVYDSQKYSLYLTSSTNPNYPTFIKSDISQYRVFRNSADREKCILALKTYDYRTFHDCWMFLVPESFRYLINLTGILDGRMLTLPKIPATYSPAYFKKGFEDTLEFIFHANGKDYLISPKNFDMTGTEAQIEITEFAEITPLPPNCCFEATDGFNWYLYWNSILHGKYSAIEPFAEKDYPEEFKSDYGYWGKDANGKILSLHIFSSTGSLKCCIESKNPMKTVHFYKRIYTSTNNAYFDIWQITHADGQKQLEIKTDGFYKHVNISIDKDAWNF